MAKYRKGSHTIYEFHYHFVFITKYRKPVLEGDIAKRTRDLIREICASEDVEILKGNVSQDHVHRMVSAPTHVSHAGGEREEQPPSVERIPNAAEGILGAASVGERILRLFDRQRDGRSDQGVY